GTKDRLKSRNVENNALGWVGWRGSREEEMYELLLLAHDIAITTANADLAFSRLKIKATALNTVALTCRRRMDLDHGWFAFWQSTHIADRGVAGPHVPSGSQAT